MQAYDVIVIGAGPAGIFTALELDKLMPQMRVLVVDSGSTIDNRSCPARTSSHCAHCRTCHIMNGWAGAGAFSDGKLSLSEEVGGNVTDYLPVQEVRDLIRYADDIYLKFGAPDKVFGKSDKFAEQVSYEAHKHNIKLIPCPVRHMGTEYSFEVLREMYRYLSSRESFEFREYTKADTIEIENGRAAGVWLIGRDGERRLEKARYIVAAPGRGGAEWLTSIARANSLQTINNAVDIGVRVEVPNAVMDHLTKNLYEAKLVYYSDTFENKVRTFCMNPGGIVSEEHYEGGVGGKGIAVVNGHSYADEDKHSENTNFAMLVSTKFTEPFNQPIEYGRYIAQLGNMLTGGGIMVQRLGDLLAHGQHRVQGGHGILEDHGDLITADLAHMCLRQIYDALALEGDGAGSDFAGTLGQKAHERQCQRGFTSAGLAHQTQRGTLFQREGDVVDGVHSLQVGFVDDAQILNV